MALTPARHGANDPALHDILILIQSSFAYMDGVINPPSSIHHFTLHDLRQIAKAGEVWSLGPPTSACVLMQAKGNALYLGKLSVAVSHQGTGLGARLIELAKTRAQALNLTALTLQSRVELTDNHTFFRAQGFAEIGRTTHQGFSTPTSISFRRQLS